MTATGDVMLHCGRPFFSPWAALGVRCAQAPQQGENAAAAASMPPKAIEGPTMTVLTTDEEWATVHGDDCSDAVKGWLHACV